MSNQEMTTHKTTNWTLKTCNADICTAWRRFCVAFPNEVVSMTNFVPRSVDLRLHTRGWL